MQQIDGRLIFSATDLSNFLACPHLSLLSRRTAFGGPKPPESGDDPGLEALKQRGLEHEKRYRDFLERDRGLRIVQPRPLPDDSPRAERYRRHAADTLAAMQAGADVIYQGCLFDGTWLGFPDFLVKVPVASRLGEWSYEVVDTKLAREAKGGALLQVLLYSEMLEAVQGIAPGQVRLALGGPGTPEVEFRVKHYSAYFRSIKRRFLAWVGQPEAELPVAVDPVSHCDVCRWYHGCNRERREADHLSFVANIGIHQVRALRAAGINSLEALGSLDPANLPTLDGVGPAALRRIQQQARLQLEGRRRSESLYELIQPIVLDQGLAALPEPSRGDLFFDLEGAPYAFEGGIEYLFGVADAEGSYISRWSLDQAGERQTFEWFIDMVMDRLEQFPDLHIYHYAPYETTAMKKLAGRYDTRIEELDQLLRSGVFVDLYRVVRQGVRASVESYSIKKMEAFYHYDRDVDLRKASAALADFEAWLEMGGTGGDAAELRREIEGYNRDDCISTLRLHAWLEQLRRQLAAEAGEEVPRASVPVNELQPEQEERLEQIRLLKERLTAGVPDAMESRTPDQQARWLVAQMLEYHRREKKSFWWQYFEWLGMSTEDLIADRSALGGLEYVGVVGQVKKSLIHRYRFPPQDTELEAGDAPRDPATGKGAGTIEAIDLEAGFIDLKRGAASQVPHPASLIPFEDVNDGVLRERLLLLGQAVAENGLDQAGPLRSSMDLVLAAPPRVGPVTGGKLARDGEAVVDAAVRLVGALDGSVLPIQGPPGAGKTYTGARMILAELARGRRVGVTATSHKVIGNLLNEVCQAAQAGGTPIRGIQKADEEQWCGESAIARTGDNGELLAALQSGQAALAAGTAWLWSRPDMIGAVDVLFIDEAGQFSLANALGVAAAATNLVLLGDPRQLQQPRKGLHPPGTDISALDHLLRGAETMPPDRGLFLDQTWRLHPEICAFTSEIYYDDRLNSRGGLEFQCVSGQGPVGGSGLRWMPVVHAGNQNESAEEVAAIASVVAGVLAAGLTWTNREKVKRPVDIGDILVVAPYNAQVSALQDALPEGARVGTVDKFQGQEAPIVIYSMASSSAEDAPRGMEFLYSPNRLNVATSRARCLVILVANDRLFFPDCRTPRQMRLANGLCRYLELAGRAG